MRKDGIQTRKRKPKSQKGSGGPKEEIKTEGLQLFFSDFLFSFPIWVFFGHFLLEFAFSGLLQSEGSVACRWSFRLFDRRSPLALPTLITQSATVSNFLPQAHKKGKEKNIVFDP